MGRSLIAIICVIALSVISAGSIHADPEECQDALNQYRSAKSDVFDAMKAYGACVRDSNGHDDCSSEFSSLQSEQDDFETAVSDYESACQ
jgi:hypothetical protein